LLFKTKEDDECFKLIIGSFSPKTQIYNIFITIIAQENIEKSEQTFSI
jgi:hypothetical protein